MKICETVQYQLGELVYHRAAPEEAGVVTGILFRSGGVQYLVAWPDRAESGHYDLELSATPSFITEPA